MDWARSTVPGDGVAWSVKFWRVSELLADLEHRMRSGTGFSVATMNLDHVVKLRSVPEFRDAYRRHSHVTADGNPVVWLERLAGRDAELVPGSDLVLPLAALAGRLDVPVALVGSSMASLQGAAAELLKHTPDLRVVHFCAPPMGFDPTGEEAGRIIADIGVSGARLCLLALGAPKQEILAASATQRLPHVGFVSVGAGLDFLSGRQVRAPQMARRLAMEWAWRLAHDPRRLASRYAAGAQLLPRLAIGAVRARLRGEPGE